MTQSKDNVMLAIGAMRESYLFISLICDSQNFHVISIVGTAPTTIKLPFREPTFFKAIEFVGVFQAICFRHLNMVWSCAVVRIYLSAFVFFVPLTIISDFSNTACGCPLHNIRNILHQSKQFTIHRTTAYHLFVIDHIVDIQ